MKDHEIVHPRVSNILSNIGGKANNYVTRCNAELLMVPGDEERSFNALLRLQHLPLDGIQDVYKVDYCREMLQRILLDYKNGSGFNRLINYLNTHYVTYHNDERYWFIPEEVYD